MKPRHWRLAGALVLTLGASVWAAMQETVDDPAPDAPRPRARAPSAAPGSARLPADRAKAPASSPAATDALPDWHQSASRTPLADEGADFAAPLSFRPPPPPPVTPRPAAPPLPFRYVGAIEEQGERRALVMQGEQLHLLRGGDEVDGRYRVERVSDAGIDFLYLPLKQRQTLSLSRS